MHFERTSYLNIINLNPTVTQKEITDMTGKSLRTVKSWMIEMQEKKLIARKKGKRDGEWIIIKSNVDCF